VDLNTQKQLTTLKGQYRTFWIVFSPDHRTLVTMGADKETFAATYTVWDVSTQRQRGTIKETSLPDSLPSFSSDGRTLAMPSEGKSIKLWDVATGQYLAALDWPNAEQALFSPDSKTLAALSKDKKLKLWFAASEAEVAAQKR
jgi:WD40 repeat protein